jgi:hypothetical protein
MATDGNADKRRNYLVKNNLFASTKSFTAVIESFQIQFITSALVMRN